MKRIASHLCTLLVGMVAVAGHFMLTQWLFGQTVAIIYLGFQLIIAAWIVYELMIEKRLLSLLRHFTWTMDMYNSNSIEQ